jgi:hypothetical protein
MPAHAPFTSFRVTTAVEYRGTEATEGKLCCWLYLPFVFFVFFVSFVPSW